MGAFLILAAPFFRPAGIPVRSKGNGRSGPGALSPTPPGPAPGVPFGPVASALVPLLAPPLTLVAADGAGALAGTVVAVTPDTAQVRYVIDTRSSVIALDQATRALGLVEGRLGGDLLMVDVRVTDTVKAGDTVISAGLPLASNARWTAR